MRKSNLYGKEASIADHANLLLVMMAGYGSK